MDTEETSEKKDKTKVPDHGFGPMGKGMFETMSACCAGRGGTSYCSAMMEGMVEKMGNRSCCAPGDADGGKNE